MSHQDTRITKAFTPQEWARVRLFRQKYFFDKVPIEDPYTWTFDHQDHLHYLLYRGDEMVGYPICSFGMN